MRLKDLETYLIRCQKSLFSFGYALIADEEITEQVIRDSEYILFTENREEIAAILRGDSKDQGAALRRLQYYLFSTVFTLARKNNLFQIPSQKNMAEVTFWKLPMDQRAILFLKQHTDFNREEISIILDLDSTQYLNKLNVAKEAMIENSGGLSFLVKEKSQ